MNDTANNPFPLWNLDSATESTKASFDTMSKAYANWLKNANSLQAEAVRFVSERFNKDLELLSRFGSCKRPEDFLGVQSDAMTQLANDYMAEGAKWVALVGDATKDLQSKAMPGGAKHK